MCDGCLFRSRGTSEDVELYVEPFVGVGMELIVLVAEFTRADSLVNGLGLGCGAVFVSCREIRSRLSCDQGKTKQTSADEEGIVASCAAISCKDIGG